MRYLTFLCVAVDLCPLDHEVTIAIGAAWAPNTGTLDVVFTADGMILEVHSTKTIQYHERVLRIPVKSIPGSPLCDVSLLKEHFARFPMTPDSMLLYKATKVGTQPIVYRDLLSFLKDLVKRVNPDDVGLHSLTLSVLNIFGSISEV